MLLSSAIANKYHEATKHTPLSVQIDPNYVDPRTQPVAFKTYPHFFRRFPLEPENSLHRFLSLTSAITYQKEYRDGTTQLLRVQPSAGGLYPTELYVQIRGIKGMLDGIYHLEPQNNVLTLIYELIDDGIEGYLHDDRLIHGCIFLVSCVYFRSSWKYKKRSLRYCFLDSGHHLGAIEAAAYILGYPYRLLFDFDRLALNEVFGFENKEFLTAVAIAGEPKEKTARRLRSPMPIVSGSDYFEPNSFIEAGYDDTFSEMPRRYSLQQPIFPLAPPQWLQATQQRRSARRFFPRPISRDDFGMVCEALQQPIPSEQLETVEIFAIVQCVTDMQPGIYRYPFSQKILKAGEFQKQTGYLCINQAIARDSAVVFFFTARFDNYRIALNQAGIIGQRIYLAATALNIGCSGIGAFFDDEVQAFLETDRSILYAMAIGQTTKE
ncbi:MAG: SagB/ThcOx family dehydrogenase [Cyanobacteria bacterium SBLK]|nr:SagB/ThcOx family dehydrogenase [Cyanobacteria bacterium SBLK]